MMNQNFKRLRVLVFFLIQFLIARQAEAQQFNITGKVTSEKGEPLQGVTITQKSTNRTSTSNAEGIYSIDLPASEGVLTFSFVGYLSQDVLVSGKSNIDISLIVNSQSFEDVVVVGYGTQKRKDLTGSVSSISAKDIADVRVPNVDQLLQGRFAGVQVSSKGGKPGANMSVNIRGINSPGGNEPLYVIDGIPVSNGGGSDYNSTESFNLNSKTSQFQSFDISSLNPNDIASIDILKDASATAIYGSRAANGVVVITTKSGQSGKSQINFNMSRGTQRLSKQIDMLDGQTFMEFMTLGRKVDNPNANFNLFDSVRRYVGNGGYNTNWQDQVYMAAPMSEYNLSASGGTDKVKYYLSGGYNNQQGIIGGPSSAFEKYTVKIRVESQVRDWIKIGLNMNGSYTSSNLVEMFNNFSPTFDALATSPLLPVKWDTTRIIGSGNNDLFLNDNRDLRAFGYSNLPGFIPGGWSGPTGVAGNEALRRNPVAQMTMNERRVKKYMGYATLFLHANLLKNLSYHIDLNGAYNNGNWYSYAPTFKYGFNNTENAKDRLQTGTTLGYQKDLAQYLTYTLSKNDLDVTLTAGHNVTYFNNSDLGGQREGATRQSYVLNNFDALGQTIGGGMNESSLQSFFARGIFSFQDKYLLTATIRRDGSDKFPDKNKYGNFPSFALAWRVSNEKFMENVNWLSDLKIRAGWGATGAQNIRPFSYLSNISGQQIANFGNNSNLQSVAMFSNIPNPDIVWETTYQTNLGFDFSLIKNHLLVTLDLYKKNTVDLLLGSFPTPLYIGFPSPTVNLGEFQNKGIELELNYRNILNNKNFTWDLGANFSKNISTVKDIGFASADKGGAGFLGAGNNTRSYVGDAYGVFYGYQVQKIFQTQAEIDALNANAVAMATKLGIANPQNARFQQNVAPGDLMFTDVHGTGPDGKIMFGQPDGKIDANDAVSLGSPLPKFIYGFNTRLNYKSFDLFVLTQGVYGNKIYNQNLRFFEALDIIDPVNQTQRAWDNRWVSESQPGDGKTPRLTGTTNNNNKQFSSRYIEDGSFFRIKNITLGYNVPQKFLSKARVTNLRLYVTAIDYFTFSKYSWYNPDLGAFRNDNDGFGVDYAGYPLAKTLMFGINLGL